MAEDRMLNDEILLGLIKANGGGGGTTNYNSLENKPQIAGIELQGDKSLADLGIASAQSVSNITNGESINNFSGVETALANKVDKVNGKGLSTNDFTDTYKTAIGDNTTAIGANTTAISGIKDGTNIDSFADVESALADKVDKVAGKVLSENDYTDADKTIVDGVTAALAGKQNALTAGDYIQFDGNEISVNREIPASNYTYELVTKSTGNDDASMTVKKYANGSLVSSTDYLYTSVSTAVNIDGYFTLQYSGNWKYTLLQASTDHASGYVKTWGYQTVVDYTEVFPTEDTSGLKLVIKSEMDSAIDSAVSRCYHHAGTKTCAELVAGLLVAANEGNVYNITDSGTTTADFIDGAGQPIKAGDNVGVAKISAGVYKFDLLSGFVDTTNFVQKSQTAGLLKNDGTVDTTIQGDVESLKSGLSNITAAFNGVNIVRVDMTDTTVQSYHKLIAQNFAAIQNAIDINGSALVIGSLNKGSRAVYVGYALKDLSYGAFVIIEYSENAFSLVKNQNGNWYYKVLGDNMTPFS